MCIICNEESNNESMMINAASMICDKNKEFKFKCFSEEFFKLCSYENIQTGIKHVLKQNLKYIYFRIEQNELSLTKNPYSLN